MISRTTEWLKRNIGRLLVLVSVAVTLLCFSVQKEGFFLDEILSYQLASAEFNPFVIPTQPVGRLAKLVEEEIRGENFGETLSNLMELVADVVENRGNSKLLQYKADVYSEPAWITRQQFIDYMTVSEKDDFNYLSVYFNARTDIHPPLYYMALHTMASVMKAAMSPMIGCVLNILLILGVCICLMKLCDLMEKHEMIPAGYGKWTGICVALLYGVSTGSIVSTVYARMYVMMALFAMMSFYLHAKKWVEDGFAAKRAGLIAVTAAGFLTQYFFVFFCVPLAIVTATMLWVKKRFKELKSYIISMIIAAVVGVGVFPFCIPQVLSSTFGSEITSTMTSGFDEYGERIVTFFRMLVTSYFENVWYGIAVLVICLALGIMTWAKKKSKEQSVPGSNSFVFWLMLFVSVCMYVILNAKASVHVAERYLAPAHPFVALVIGVGIVSALSLVKRLPGYLMLVPTVALAVAGILLYDGEYLYTGYEEQLELAAEYSELPCVCVYRWDWFYENMPEMMEYERSLITTPEELQQRQEITELKSFDEVVVIRKYHVEEDEMWNAIQQFGWELQEILMDEVASPYGDTIYLFRKSADASAEMK